MSDLGRELMGGVVVGAGKRLDEVGQRLAHRVIHVTRLARKQSERCRVWKSQ
jgi:hypothetical protein